MAFYCYIVASGQNGTLYIGSTDCLTTRIGQHKNKAFDGFTANTVATRSSGSRLRHPGSGFPP